MESIITAALLAALKPCSYATQRLRSDVEKGCKLLERYLIEDVGMPFQHGEIALLGALVVGKEDEKLLHQHSVVLKENPYHIGKME